jgi:transcriptional regulator with XRE-family HTH domain
MVQKVSSEAGISLSYLSQIERNPSKLPISVLMKIGDVLGARMNWFFQTAASSPPGERDVVIRKGNRRRLTSQGRCP